MRNTIAPCITVIISTTLIFLITTAEKSSAHPALAALATAVSTAYSVLGPVVEKINSDSRTLRDSEAVEVRVWMHTGNPDDNGCGFYFKVTGHSGTSVDNWFPPLWSQKCGLNRYDMRITSQSVMYKLKLQLGNDQTKEIQLHADGWHDTLVKMICFRFSERTIVGGPRAFCIDSTVLKSCKALENKWIGINLDSDSVILTRTTNGIHKIILKDVEKLIEAFENIARDPGNVDAALRACQRIELEIGTSVSSQGCPAERTPHIPYSARAAAVAIPNTREEKINPDNCERSIHNFSY